MIYNRCALDGYLLRWIYVDFALMTFITCTKVLYLVSGLQRLIAPLNRTHSYDHSRDILHLIREPSLTECAGNASSDIGAFHGCYISTSISTSRTSRHHLMMNCWPFLVGFDEGGIGRRFRLLFSWYRKLQLSSSMRVVVFLEL